MFVDTFILDTDDNAGYYLYDEVATATVVKANTVAVGRCIVDKLYMESGTKDDIASWDGSFPTEWGWDTLMQADFNDSLYAGSVNYSIDVVSEIRIKRRKKGDTRWKTLYIKKTDKISDFQFSYIDYLAAGNSTYEYMLVPLVTGEEGAATVVEIESEFRDFYIIDRNQSYHIVLDATNDIQYNVESSAQTTIARKYPFIIKNGSVGYYSGTVKATFLELVDCEWDVENGAHFRKLVDQFLANDNVKILKDEIGNIWLIMVVDSISQDCGDGILYPVHSFSWTECGDAEGIGDLYDNGFINTQIDRE